MGKSKEQKKQEELFKTLGDFTSKENWDQFFTIRGSDDSFEWYAEWPQLKIVLLGHLCPSALPSDDTGLGQMAEEKEKAVELQILIPGCGNSKLSEILYDVGYRNITNIDFSKVVISDMLRRNVRSRPGMKWRVMDMTNMQVEIYLSVLELVCALIYPYSYMKVLGLTRRLLLSKEHILSCNNEVRQLYYSEILFVVLRNKILG